ncbi:hypothetical protein K505DRAFT_333759 [Melanomma pulvis-pyrius CBS 109.77]|uniref:Uncharacterized protein n=1 Tax=Melanomma pulvis-pyrius CBS 109.77 TaxID=1314802 RepID=A0A6A6XNW7_9PLEO|nr:hypothetical protein K505DRAFT_333759 [Melanomma pulvis-pyrius CBS 109.77]
MANLSCSPTAINVPSNNSPIIESLRRNRRIELLFACADHCLATGQHDIVSRRLAQHEHMRQFGTPLMRIARQVYDKENELKWNLKEMRKRGSALLTEEQREAWQPHIQSARESLTTHLSEYAQKGASRYCPRCNTKFTRYDSLRRHLQKKKCAQPLGSTTQRSNPRRRGTIIGPECRTVLGQHSALIGHLQDTTCGQEQERTDQARLENPRVRKSTPPVTQHSKEKKRAQRYKTRQQVEDMSTLILSALEGLQISLNSDQNISYLESGALDPSDGTKNTTERLIYEAQLAAKDEELKKLREVLANRTSEILRCREIIADTQKQFAKALEDAQAHKTTVVRELVAIYANQESLQKDQRLQIVEANRDRAAMAHQVRAFVGEIDLSGYIQLPIRLNNSSKIVGRHWNVIRKDIKYFSFPNKTQLVMPEHLPSDIWSTFRSLFFSASGIATHLPSDNLMDVDMILELQRLHADGIMIRSIMRCLASVAVCKLVFGAGTSAFNDRKWAYSDEYWRILNLIGADLNVVRRTAICIHRKSMEYMREEIVPSEAKRLAIEFSTICAPFFPGYHKQPVPGAFACWGQSQSVASSRQRRTEKCFLDAFHLVMALELSAKDHSFIFFPPGTPFESKYMEAENDNGSNHSASAKELERKMVKICLSPVFIECSEVDLNSLSGFVDVGRALPTSKRFLQQFERLREPSTTVCAKAVVLLQ